MQKKFFSLIFIFLVKISTSFPQASNYLLSKNSIISVITMQPTTDKNNWYGHSCIRIFDHKNNIDELFDLSYYDSKSKLAYRVHSRFIDALKNEQLNHKRNWYEQELNLTLEEKQKIFELLILSSNGLFTGYETDLVFENAPTKIISMLKLILNDKLDLQIKPESLRTILNNCLISQTEFLKNNLFFGNKTDDLKLTSGNCFTAEQLKNALSSSFTIDPKSNEKIPLVLNERLLVNYEDSSMYTQFFTEFSTNIILLIILILVFLLTIGQFFLNAKNNALKSIMISIKSIELLFFVFIGTLGCIILINDFFTFENANILFINNFNFLWLLPTNLFMAFSILSVKKSIFISFYWLFNLLAILVCALLFYLDIFNQYSSISNYILMAIIFIRSIYHSIRFFPFKTKKPILNQEPAILN